ncbi:MAG: hypothetical protein ACOYJB_04905 [Christensenellaceae bacterium]
MKAILPVSELGFISEADRSFIAAFDGAMKSLGYEMDGGLRDGFCWGKHMLVYVKSGVKSKKSYARVYIRENEVVLRMYFSNVDRHRAYIEASPVHIKDAFTREHGTCGHCHNEKEGKCSHRKAYILDGTPYEKCDGFTFEFWQPEQSKIPDYVAVFTEFYPSKTK